jgi:hypothetical protein
MAYRLPFDGNYNITCSYACHLSSTSKNVRTHAGVDWGMPVGTPLYNIEAGTTTNGWDSGGGGLVVHLTSTDKHRVWEYLHLSSLGHVGVVEENWHIGFSGNSGITTGPHLHLALYVDGVRKDPMTLLVATPKGAVGIGQYVMFRKNTNVRSGDGTSYPIQTVAKEGSVWYVQGGPRTKDGYEWWDIHACDQTNGDLVGGTGWCAMRLTGGEYWVVVVPKPVPPVVDPCIAKLAAQKVEYEKLLAAKDKQIADITSKAHAEAPVLEASASRLKSL